MKKFLQNIFRKSRISEILRGRSIQWLISLSFTAISIASMSFMALAFYTHFINNMRENAIEQNRQVLDQVSWSLNTYLRNMMNVSDTMYYEVIKKKDLSNEFINTEMNLLYEANKDNLTSIVCTTNDGAILAAAPVSSRKPGVNLKQEEWFTAAQTQIENMHFSTPHVQNLFESSNYRYNWVVSLSRSIEINHMGNIRNGVLLVDMNYSGIESMFSRINEKGTGYIYLIDGNGEIIYHPRQKAIYTGQVRENNLEHAKYQKATNHELFEGESRDVVIKNVGYTGWKIVSVTPLSELSMNVSQFRLFMLMIGIATIALIVFGNIIIAYIVTDPVRRLEESLNALEEGIADEEVIYIGGSQEIEHLGRTIKSMVAQMRRLTDEMVREQKEKRKSELDALQSQINPHFLYNTLDSVVWMIESERYKAAISMVTSLAQLFRISLSKGSNIILIRDEITHARNYVSIQQVRFKNKFNATIDVDPAIEDYVTIKLIVQPLIENAIYYGVQHMDDGDGEIHIKGYEKDGDIFIEVSDNGMGIPKEELATLLSDKTRSRGRGSGIGLWNVNQRISLYFKGEYGLKIDSELDEGTTVTIHLPKMTMEEYRKEADR